MITWLNTETKPFITKEDDDLERQGYSDRVLCFIEDGTMYTRVFFGRFNHNHDEWMLEGLGTRFKVKAWSPINYPEF